METTFNLSILTLEVENFSGACTEHPAGILVEVETFFLHEIHAGSTMLVAAMVDTFIRIDG